MSKEEMEFDVYLDGEKLEIEQGNLSASVIIKPDVTITRFRITLKSKKRK
jgi:hypothetical protein